MKKMIRDRSIFAVVASVIMAAVMLFCSAQPAPVHLPAEARAILGQEADASFSQFFTKLHNWYDSYTVGEDGITLTFENDYEAMGDVVLSAAEFLEAYNTASYAESDETLMVLETNCADMLGFLVNYLVVVVTLEQYGAYPMDAPQWAALGEAIDGVTAIYQG